jgi:GntR family transcriptional regulator/MocR family aminotransferase
MSMERREELLNWSRVNSSWILENEIDGDYRYTSRPSPPLYAMSGGHQVIYCGSLSKPLAPGLRINYLVVPKALISRLTLRSTLAPMLTQLVLARFSSSGLMSSHMRKMRLIYAKRRALLVDALKAEGDDLFDVHNLPEGGLRLMVALHSDVNDVLVTQRCREAGLKIDPLSESYMQASIRSGLIMGFASTPEDRIEPAVHILADILRRAMP